jgi:endonuclease/exonuclease/phosphatase family metal-dependent hydrolase
MRFITSSLFFIAALSSFMLRAQSPVIPMTSEEVAHYRAHIQQNVLDAIDRLTAIAERDRTFENTFHPWNQLSNQLLADLSLLSFLTYTPLRQSATDAIAELHSFLFKELMNPALRKVLFTCMQKEMSERRLNPYQQYIFHSVIEAIPEENPSLEILKHSAALAKRKPFLYLKGEAREKMTSDDAITLFSVNTCFAPGILSLIHGGVAPWQQRVSHFAEKILSANADIVCLQEVHAEEASSALFEALKKSYAHFYTAIGPRPLGITLQALGLPSGLFVASKYALETPTFTLFATKGLPMNWGVFDFVAKSGKDALAHIYTTHLHSLNHADFPQVRALQLGEIIDKMQRDRAALPEIPFYLCGDFNIPFGAGEPGQALIKTHFYDAFNEEELPVSERHHTAVDYFTHYFLSATKNPAEIDPNFQILDYALLLKSADGNPLQQRMKTSLILMNRLDDPEAALSDHHGLFTTLLRN